MKYNSRRSLSLLLLFCPHIIFASDSKIGLSQEEVGKVCQTYCCPSVENPIKPKKKHRKHKRPVVVPPIAKDEVKNIVIELVILKQEKEAPSSIAPVVLESPDYWINASAGLAFEQFLLKDNNGNEGKILSDSLLKLRVENIFKLNDNILASFNLGLDSLSLESPLSQKIDRSSSSLYSFGLGFSWVEVKNLSLSANLGYRNEMYFRNFNSTIINVDKFLVLYSGLSAKYVFLEKKNFKLAGKAFFDFETGFTSSLGSNGNYNVGSSEAWGFSVIFQKEFRNLTLETAIFNNHKFKNSDQGEINENEIGVGLNFIVPLEWSSK